MQIKGVYWTSDFLMKRGIEIDFSKKCFRKADKLFWLFNINSACKPLPDIKYVLLFKTLYNKCQSCRIGDFDKNSVVQLSLIHGDNQKLIVHESTSLEGTKQLAINIAKEFNLKIKDAASNRRAPEWVSI